ncbi:protein serine/threonine kinase activating protein [Pichia kluyveri]|uniref:Protein serine/threonine kinase activating protein n=1 Tax=Pichia kluyveri TaxID=36015 RepID=A0AAV5R5V5_PICKL|nr:protein serine/threonine kinase activating protein [Pichia kluyveri]
MSTDRPALKDTSRLYVNTPSARAIGVNLNNNNNNNNNANIINDNFSKGKDGSLVRKLKMQPPPTPQRAAFQLVPHINKLSSGDKFPHLMGTSTPKKDGYLPSLLMTKANPNQNNTNEKTQIATGKVANKKMTGDELAKWKENWRDILTRSYIYYEHYDPNDKDQRKTMLAFKRLGSVIDTDYSNKTTIVISKRQFDRTATYPAGDLFSILAKKASIKVWSYPKVYRFLNHLSEHVPTTDDLNNSSNSNPVANANSNLNNINNNLNNLLMNEKLFGPSDRDPNVKRNDFKYFANQYLYIWDITEKTRPICIREWKDKNTIPRIHHTTNGKSLFVTETKSQNALSLLRRHQRRVQCLEETFQFRQEIIVAAYNSNYIVNREDIHTPEYNDRVQYKRTWEDSFYITKPENEHPITKLKELYDSLEEKEKDQFKELFENNIKYPIESENLIVELPLQNQNKRQKIVNGDFNKILKTVEEVENKGILTDKTNTVQNIKNIDVKNRVKNYNNDLDIEKDEDDEDNDMEDLNNLISDKSDVIDKMSLRITDNVYTDFKENNQNHKRVHSNVLKPSFDSTVMPKLMRQDSIMKATLCNSNPNNDGKLLCEYGEIAASGIQASGMNPSGNALSGNGLGPSRSQVVSKRLANEQRRIVVLTPSMSKTTKSKEESESNKNIVNVNRCNDNTENYVSLKIGLIDEEKQNSTASSINKDDLAALRSVEAANNPFISDGCLKNNGLKNIEKINEIKNNDQNINKLQKKTIKENELNDNPLAQLNTQLQKHKNEEKSIAIGLFKEQRREKVKREPKPGYCENCRVKYPDFTDHVASEKHRSFAQNDANFSMIDDLINFMHHSDMDDEVIRSPIM